MGLDNFEYTYLKNSNTLFNMYHSYQEKLPNNWHRIQNNCCIIQYLICRHQIRRYYNHRKVDFVFFQSRQGNFLSFQHKINMSDHILHKFVFQSNNILPNTNIHHLASNWMIKKFDDSRY
jgi:hypothetical protein